MASRENVKNRPDKTLLEVPIDSDLPLRLDKISEQTGLSPLNLFQKWILQEEFLLGFMKYNKEQAAKQTKVRPITDWQEILNVLEQEEAGEIDISSPNYRKRLAKMAKKLKKEGMTLKNIAEFFNDERVQTVSGSGQWYSSSIANLLKSKI